MRVGTSLLWAVTAILAFADADAASLEDWRRDVDEIVHDILAVHPAPFQKVGELAWRREAAAFSEALPSLTEPQRLVRLMQLVALIGDGHTWIDLEDEAYALWYPFRLYEFSEGYFVTSVHKSWSDLAGAEILSIADRPADQVVNAARTLFGADNDFDAKERLYAVQNAYLMRGLGYARQDYSLDVTFRLTDGSQVTRTFQAQATKEGSYAEGVPIFEWRFPSEVYGLPVGDDAEWIAAYKRLPSSAFLELDETRPLFLQQRTKYTRRALPAQDAYYIQLNQTDDSGMVQFMGESLVEVDQMRPRRLIIDMRYNFGGDGSTVIPMIHQFIRRENDKPWKELYLIVGRKSFSAALAAIDAFIDHTEVTVVGEPPGAALNSFGDPERHPYPALGLNLEVSTVRHQLSQSSDLRSYVPIDVPAPMSFADYSAGHDPAVDPILAGREMRSIPVIARVDGGRAARRAFAERQQKYGAYPWYPAPTEISLRFVVFDLIEQERFEAAVEAARLNTEIHPYTWNTWYNLANALIAAGPPHDEKCFECFQCVIELAPSNWNVPSIRAFFDRNNVSPKPAPGCPAGNH